MKEREPKIESESPEQKLISLLREKGPEDGEARDLLISWTIEQERLVEQSSDPEAPIQLNLRRARLYFEAGYIDEAMENFEAAADQAWNEKRNELYEAVMEEMDQIEDSLER
jgi:hypothetical protein